MSSSNASAPGQPPSEEWLRAQLRALPDPVMPSALADELMAAIRTEQADSPGVAATHPTGAPGEQVPSESTAGRGGSPRRRGVLAGLAAAAAAVVGIALVVNSPSQPGDYETVMALSSVQPVSTNVGYTLENIEESVLAHLQALESRSGTVLVASESLRRGSFAANDQVMASCLAGVGAAPSNLRMVDLADYHGQPSGILVFDGTGGNLIVVVAPRCAAEDPRVRLRLNNASQ